MKTIKQLITNYSKTLKHAGFQYHKNSWYLMSPSIILVIDFQSQKPYLYINIVYWINQLGEIVFPKTYQCHLHHRIEDYFPEEKKLIYAAMNSETCDEITIVNFSDFLSTKASPYLIENMSIENLRHLYKEGKLIKGLILQQARSIFEDNCIK
jgi:hypothetical protein